MGSWFSFRLRKEVVLAGAALLFLLKAGTCPAAESGFPFSLEVRLSADLVVIAVTNRGPDAVLREDLVIEQWSGSAGTWRFAASPLWMCATKETVFERSAASGGTITIAWRLVLHDHCRKAEPGRYRALIRNRQGALLAAPAEFHLEAGPPGGTNGVTAGRESPGS